MGRRRFWRIVLGVLALVGMVSTLLGLFFCGMVVQADCTWPGRIATIKLMVPPAATVAGFLLLYFSVGRILSIDLDAINADDDLEEGAPEEPAPPASPGQKPSRIDALLKARDFLPDEMPESWTRPVAVGGSLRWTFDTKAESVSLLLKRRKWMTCVEVDIVGKGTREPVSDARCAAILAHVRHVTEFIEIGPDEEHPEVRTWVSIPTGLRPRWEVPESIPAARERVLSPHLVAARKYLPQKLPHGWSVPVAVGDDHGTEWKDGAWMIGTADDRLILVCLVTSKGRVKLSVTFFGTDKIPVSEGNAVDMLRHFRGVLEFAQTEATAGDDDEVPTRTYLGELAPEGGARVLLN